MSRGNGSFIGGVVVPSDTVPARGIFNMAEQNYLQSTARWNTVVYESIASVLVNSSSSITVTVNSSSNVNIIKTSGSVGWDTSVRMTTGYTAPCTIEFNKAAPASDDSSGYCMIGWNEDPTTNNSYTDMDHASYPYATNNYSVYHNGNIQSPLVLSWSTAQKFYIVYTTAGHLKHYNGSTLLYNQTGYGAGKTVYLDTSLYSVNTVNGGFTNVRITRNEWNGTKYLL